jgi:hypothetical protein
LGLSAEKAKLLKEILFLAGKKANTLLLLPWLLLP